MKKKSVVSQLERGSEDWKKYKAWLRRIDGDLRSMERWFDSGFQAVEAEEEDFFYEEEDVDG